MEVRTILLGLNAYYKGDWKKIYNHLCDKKEFTPEMEKLGENLNDNQDLITIMDNDYPKELKKAYQPDFIITRKQISRFYEILKSPLITNFEMNIPMAIYFERQNKFEKIEQAYKKFIKAEKEFCDMIKIE